MIFIVFFSDLALKTYLKNYFFASPLALIKPFLYINVVFNDGAAFGILRGRTNLLIYAGVLCIVIFLILFNKFKKSKE